MQQIAVSGGSCGDLEQSGDQDDSCAVFAGEFIGAGGDAAPLLEASDDAAFDHIAAPVDAQVEQWRASAALAAACASGLLVGVFRDGPGDPAALR
ncbi:hypothetical protein AB0C84_45085 [Actinomadura sp. NPDC048955]|uniref:hypothetical protein n=1 Tax=Actinomadura sp. NPDC048955 TaxID=3158228 RepID=UPI0033D7B006